MYPHVTQFQTIDNRRRELLAAETVAGPPGEGNVTTVRRLASSLLAVCALAVTGAALADSTPVEPLPPGPVSTIATHPGQLVAVALPHAAPSSGLVWRIARRYDATVVRQVSEADVGSSVVLVFKVIAKGRTALVFALTRGDTSSRAVRTSTHKILAS
jgi:hypothetical protein